MAHRVGEAQQRTFGSAAFTRAPYHRDRAEHDNERQKAARIRRFGQSEPPAMATYRTMPPDRTVAQLQELEHEIWALGREKRRMDGAAFVTRLAKSSAAHKAKVAGRSRRHARKTDEEAQYGMGDENDAERDARLLDEELEKLDTSMWDAKVRGGGGGRGGRGGGGGARPAQAVSRRAAGGGLSRQHSFMANQQIRDERSDPALRLPSPGWEEQAAQPPQQQPTADAAMAAHAAWQPRDPDPVQYEVLLAQHRPRLHGNWTGVVGTGAAGHWAPSEPSAQAEVLSLRHSIEVQQMHSAQMLQELQARQIIERCTPAPPMPSPTASLRL